MRKCLLSSMSRIIGCWNQQTWTRERELRYSIILKIYNSSWIANKQKANGLFKNMWKNRYYIKTENLILEYWLWLQMSKNFTSIRLGIWEQVLILTLWQTKIKWFTSLIIVISSLQITTRSLNKVTSWLSSSSKNTWIKNIVNTK